MKTGIAAALSHALILASVSDLRAQSAEPQSPSRPEVPLVCRGGAGLVFDTLLPPTSAQQKTRLMLSFAAASGAGGQEGQGLAAGTCAWVDRPLNNDEPRRIEFVIGAEDTAPDRTTADAGMYWSFLALNEEEGRLTGIGYRHWHDSSPPIPLAAPAAVASPYQLGRFDLRYLPLAGVALGAILWAPLVSLIARSSGWRRLAGQYPDRNTGRAPSFRGGQMIMNRSVYKGSVRFTPDESHLHVSQSVTARPGHQPFSVPWSDVTAARDEWPWFPMKGHPMVRLTLAAEPDLRILVKLRDGERIVAASGGQLALDDRRAFTAVHS